MRGKGWNEVGKRGGANVRLAKEYNKYLLSNKNQLDLRPPCVLSLRSLCFFLKLSYNNISR
jgi:hypothetical protein